MVVVRNNGQLIGEYVLILGVFAAAVLGIQLYVKRGLQAAVKTASDQLGDQLTGIRYESGDPRLNRQLAVEGRTIRRNSAVTTTAETETELRTTTGGGRTTTVLKDETTTEGSVSDPKGVSFYAELVAEVR